MHLLPQSSGASVILKVYGETAEGGGELWALLRLGIFQPGGAVYLYEATADASEGTITGKKVNSDNELVGDDETFIVLGEGS